MEDVIQKVLENLTFTGIGLALFIICYVSNMAFSIWCNTKIHQQEFDWSRLLNSILKIVVFGIGTILLCIGVTTIPIFCEYVGLVIPEAYALVFEKLAIISVFVFSACKYLLEAFQKFKSILGYDAENNSTEEEFLASGSNPEVKEEM